MSEEIRLGGLWKRTSKAGKEYWGSAKFNDLVDIHFGDRIVVYPNAYKERDEQPDYVMVLYRADDEAPARAPVKPTRKGQDDIPF